MCQINRGGGGRGCQTQLIYPSHSSDKTHCKIYLALIFVQGAFKPGEKMRQLKTLCVILAVFVFGPACMPALNLR